MKRIAFAISLVLCSLSLAAQDNIHYEWQEGYVRKAGFRGTHCANPRRVAVPDIPGFKTYKADLHMHTIFSDAQVTPMMRVYEAWYENIDILAITDHHPDPRTKFDNGDMNRSYREASKYASDLGVKLIRGFELTTGEPIGHINVLFLKDVNEYKLDYPVRMGQADSLLLKAQAEGAFITTNHPGWPDENSFLSDYIKNHIGSGLIKGIEVFNDAEFYPMAIDHANNYGLTMLGCTDSHYPTYFSYDQKDNHRAMTLVFAKDGSDEGIKEALNAHRTIAWANNKLAGREGLLKSFLHACIKVEFVREEAGLVHFRVYNCSDIPFLLENENPQEVIRIPANGYAESWRKADKLGSSYTVKNAYITSTKHLEVPLSFLLEGDYPLYAPALRPSSVEFTKEGFSFALAVDEGDTYYTLDGSEPTTASTLYDGSAITLKESATMRAVTVNGGYRSAEATIALPFSMAVKCKAKRNGVKFTYFEHPDILSTKDIEKLGVVKKSGVYSDLLITDGVGKDHFGFVFTGFIKVEQTGVYHFNLASNDGSELFIGGVLTVDNDSCEGYKIAKGSIYLEKGCHPFVLRYFEGYGGESLRLEWVTPGDKVFSKVPAENLFIE